MQNGILDQLGRLEHLLHRYYGHGRKGDTVSPHRGQGRILSILKLQPEISQRELGYLLDMSKQSVAELLAKLESKGYITREQSGEDRRAMNIRLTEAGAKAAETVQDEVQDHRELPDVLTEEEQEALSDYLQRLTEALEAELGPEPERGHGPHHGGGDCGKGRGRGHGHGHEGHGGHGPELQHRHEHGHGEK